MPALNKLNPEDIDEKIRINHKDGIDIYALYLSLKDEYTDCKWNELRSKVQCQILLDEIDEILEAPLKHDNDVDLCILQQSIKDQDIKKRKDDLRLFRSQEITSACQCQFYIEQIEHVEKRIKEINARPNKDNPFCDDDYAERLIPALLLR